MNKVYRLVWSRVVNGWVCCAETARGRGKSGTTRKLVVGAVALAGSALLSPAVAAPSGGVVSAGSGTISQSGSTTTINQSTQNLAINWQNFNIGANEAVTFNQPNAGAIALNRVTGQDPSQILGSLSANGQVFVLNPNGVLFGQGAQVNVGGLVATTLGLSDADLMAGNTTFSGSGGSVVNQGTLTATQGGYIALLAPEVRNEGVISATKGTALLGAGDKVTLKLDNGSLVSYSIDQGALNALADNQQLIEADGGQVYLSARAADALSTAVVNNSGIIQARTLQNVNGTIMLMGDMQSGTVNVDGTLDASAPDGGNGGFIETSAAHVQVADSANVTTLAVSGESGTWLIDPVDFTIAASGGDITGAAVSTALAGGNLTIQSNSGATGTAGDINVNDVVAWMTNTLTLSAQNDININAYMRTTDGGLALEFGLGALAAGNSSNLNTASGVKVDLGSTSTYTTRQGADGVMNSYTIISTLAELQGMDTLTNYALGGDIDASASSSWNGGAGFVPIGNIVSPYMKTFDGLGHTISGLTINRPTEDYVGLFGVEAGVIRNVGLSGGSVTGHDDVGGLVGKNFGTINNSSTGSSVSGSSYVGGLVGEHSYYQASTFTPTTSAVISNSYATGSVSGVGGNGIYTVSNGYVGGLVGVSYDSVIRNSYATGSVSGVTNTAGGLVGWNSGDVANSYATGNVSNVDAFAGGLVGANYAHGVISDSYATGNISNVWSAAGGLVGANWGYIYIPGAQEIRDGIIRNSYATGSVSGTNDVGGLVGSYYVSTVTPGSISNSYATGSVTGTSNVGGLLGYYDNGNGEVTISNSFWDVTTTGQATSAGGTGLTTAQMMNLSSFSGWDIANTGGNGATWRIYEGNTAPLLTGFLSELTLTDAPDASATYNGTAQSANATSITGVLGSAASGTNAGVYNGYYSTQQGYDLIGGNLTINEALLTVTADNQYRLYGEANPTLTQTFSGFVNGETLATSGVTGTATGTTAATATTNVGSAAIVASTAGLSATNYDFVASAIDGTLTIDKAHLTVTADDQSRLYGEVNPAFTQTISGFVNGETLATSGVTGTATGSTTATQSTPIGTATIVASSAGLSAGNYDFTTLVDGTLSIIPPAYYSIYAAPYSISPAVAEAIVTLPGGDVELLPVFGNTMAAEATSPEPVVMAMVGPDESLSSEATLNTTVEADVASSTAGQAEVTLVGDGIRLPDDVMHSLR